MEMEMTAYHYTECGLDNVFIEGFGQVEDHNGEATMIIPAIGLLHKVISQGIVSLKAKMTGKELRFLRTEMGLTQAKLAEIIKVSSLTVSRWERDEFPLDDGAEVLIRLLAIHELDLDTEMDVEAVSDSVTADLRHTPIRIDGSNPNDYQLMAA